MALVMAVATAACSSSSPSAATVEQGTGGQLVFSPTAITAKAGSALTIKNVGSAPHTFTISGQGIDVTNDTGQTHQVTLNLSPGTYPFICRFHEGSGMKGTLTVTS